MTRRFPLLLLVAVLLMLLALPSPALAQPNRVRAEIDNLSYTDLGSSTVSTLESGKVLVSTTGLMGSGTLACNGSQACEDAGLAGETLKINQDLQILIDVTGAGIKVRGRTRGFIVPGESENLTFKGSVKGQATCIGTEPSPCQQLDIEMGVRARLFDPDSGDAAGRLSLNFCKITRPLVSLPARPTRPNW